MCGVTVSRTRFPAAGLALARSSRSQVDKKRRAFARRIPIKKLRIEGPDHGGSMPIFSSIENSGMNNQSPHQMQQRYFSEQLSSYNHFQQPRDSAHHQANDFESSEFKLPEMGYAEYPPPDLPSWNTVNDKMAVPFLLDGHQLAGSSAQGNLGSAQQSYMQSTYPATSFSQFENNAMSNQGQTASWSSFGGYRSIGDSEQQFPGIFQEIQGTQPNELGSGTSTEGNTHVDPHLLGPRYQDFVQNDQDPQQEHIEQQPHYGTSHEQNLMATTVARLPAASEPKHSTLVVEYEGYGPQDLHVTHISPKFESRQKGAAGSNEMQNQTAQSNQGTSNNVGLSANNEVSFKES